MPGLAGWICGIIARWAGQPGLYLPSVMFGGWATFLGIAALMRTHLSWEESLAPPLARLFVAGSISDTDHENDIGNSAATER